MAFVGICSSYNEGNFLSIKTLWKFKSRYLNSPAKCGFQDMHETIENDLRQRGCLKVCRTALSLMSAGIETRWERLMIRTLHGGKDRKKNTSKLFSFLLQSPTMNSSRDLCQAHERRMCCYCSQILLLNCTITGCFFTQNLAAMAPKIDLSGRETCLKSIGRLLKTNCSRLSDKGERSERYGETERDSYTLLSERQGIT